MLWKCADVPRNSPTSKHAQKELTCSNGSLYPREQYYLHKNTSARVFIVWELKELTEYCQLLKKGSESALEVRRCTMKFSHVAHMRRRRSPVPMQVYSPVNSSMCIRTPPQVYSLCESWNSQQSIVSCLKRALKMLWKCADVPRNSPTLHTCAEGDHLFQCKFTSQWTVLYA